MCMMTTYTANSIRDNKPISEIEKEKTMLMGVCNTSVNKVRTDYGFHCKGWESIPKKA